ncbi:claudin-1 [Alosa sapidissima]|uniref:claudin-1 n=1 Tax=Alosa sapidissima TaxID=34773 RepID=UPI001C08F595|nr:claudin-1 [Alosa sapidissima]
MANGGVQLLGFSLAVLGFFGIIASTAMVEWKASSYAGDNIITAQAIHEGLWMSCVSQSTGQIQCKEYDSLLQLSGELQATRGLMVFSILLVAISILVAAVGMKCTACLAENKQQKNKIALAGGIIFIIGGLSALIATSMYGHKIAKDFYNPFTPTNAKYEFGAALFVGWAASVLAIIGGGFLCCNCSTDSSGKGQMYPPTRGGVPGTHV